MQKPLLLVLLGLVLFAAGCCSIPSFTPSFWNDYVPLPPPYAPGQLGPGVVTAENNCYNYANNKRTDTFAQPGRSAGAKWGFVDCSEVTRAAIADGLEPWPPSGKCGGGWWWLGNYTKLALVVSPGYEELDADYHWYRLDANGMWTHKPGRGWATNLDNSKNPITNPETADRGYYVYFCGYFCSCSNYKEGTGHENIN